MMFMHARIFRKKMHGRRVCTLMYNMLCDAWFLGAPQTLGYPWGWLELAMLAIVGDTIQKHEQ